MRSQHLGPEELLVAAKVELESYLSFDEVALAIDDADARLRQRLPSTVHLYIEPDFGGDGSTPAPTGREEGPSGPSPSA